MKKRVAQIAVPKPVPGALSYSVPDEFLNQVKIGSLVEIPFRSSKCEGFVIGFIEPDHPSIKDMKLKPISAVLFEECVFDPKDLTFFNWISDYYQLPIGEVFSSAFPKSVFKILKRKSKPDSEAVKRQIKDLPIFSLTEDQTTAFEKIKTALSPRKFKSFLLFGVTGSGKTEIYLRAAKQALEQGQSALILVPEIALTPQLRTRFEERFGNEVAVLHSSLSDKVRREFWWSILRGERRVVVGARSALFAPLQNIGLIIVDEEHEPSYKQEDRLRYNARDLAIVRAHQHGAAVILGSATPSIETFHAASKGKHELLELRTRPESRPMPTTEIIDLKDEPFPEGEYKHQLHGGFGGVLFSKKMIDGIRESLEKKEQAILFVNRKGYSSFLMCSDCGEAPECLNCSVSMTYYKSAAKLRCHYCALELPVPKICAKCNSKNMKLMGIGTEFVEKELCDEFKEARITRLDADTADTAKKIEDILERFRNGEIDILVGTQMLAKGHDFPNVTFIGVVLADLNLHLPDFRASERTFQLLSQVSGRAGRGDKLGKVVLQTFMPDHYVIQTATQQDYRKFYAEEISHRETFEYPPFSKIAQIEFRHLKELQSRSDAERAAALLDHLLKSGQTDVQYLGPTPASIAKIANQYRWHILLKAEKSSSLNAIIKTLRKGGVRFIDVDPVTTL